MFVIDVILPVGRVAPFEVRYHVIAYDQIHYSLLPRSLNFRTVIISRTFAPPFLESRKAPQDTVTIENLSEMPGSPCLTPPS